MADSWQGLDLADLVPKEPAPTLVASSATVASDLSDVLTTMSDAIGLLTGLALSFTDPFAVIVDQLISDIVAFVTNVINTDAFMLIQPPKVGGIDGFIDDLSNSFFDVGDQNRPPFFANENVGGIIVVAGAPDPILLKDFLGSLGFVFGIQQFINFQFAFDNPVPQDVFASITAVDAPNFKVTDITQSFDVDEFATNVGAGSFGTKSAKSNPCHESAIT